MSRTQKYYSKIIIALIVIAASPSRSFAQKTMEYRQTAEFQMQREKMAAIFGCNGEKDKYCTSIRTAETETGLWLAASAKKKSDDKRTAERISVLECCLGIDTKDTCEGLTPSAKKDLENCKKKVEK